MCTALSMQTMHPFPSGIICPCSSPPAAKVPVPVMSPYRPAPTSMVSPSDAFSIAWLIERHGADRVPHVPESAPLFATHRVMGACDAEAVTTDVERTTKETARVTTARRSMRLSLPLILLWDARFDFTLTMAR